MRDWDAHFIRRAALTATMGTCSRRQVGAVAVRDRRAFADGFNGNLSGQLHCNEGGCARCSDPSQASGVDLHNCVCVHAEENIVTWCAKTGTALGGATIYSTHKPCILCTKLLFMAGVVEVVYFADYPSPMSDIPGMIVRQLEVDPEP